MQCLQPQSEGTVTYEECKTKIDRMAELKDGWDSYKAKAPNAIARNNTDDFCQVACRTGLEPDRVEASCMAAVGLTFDGRGGREAYVEFYNTGRACYALCDDATEECKTAMFGADGESYQMVVELILVYLEGTS